MQPTYLIAKPYKSTRRKKVCETEEIEKSDAHVDRVSSIIEEKRGEEKKREEIDLSKLPFKAQNKIFELKEQLKEKEKEAQKPDEYFKSKRIDKGKLLDSIKKTKIEIEQIINEWSK